MLEQEVLDQVAGLTVVFRIHGHLSEEVFHCRIGDSECSESVPEVVQCEESLGTGLAALVFRSNEASSELDRKRKVFLYEFL